MVTRIDINGTARRIFVLQDKKRLPGRFHAAIAGEFNSRAA